MVFWPIPIKAMAGGSAAAWGSTGSDTTYGGMVQWISGGAPLGRLTLQRHQGNGSLRPAVARTIKMAPNLVTLVHGLGGLFVYTLYLIWDYVYVK